MQSADAFSSSSTTRGKFVTAINYRPLHYYCYNDIHACAAVLAGCVVLCWRVKRRFCTSNYYNVGVIVVYARVEVMFWRYFHSESFKLLIYGILTLWINKDDTMCVSTHNVRSKYMCNSHKKDAKMGFKGKKIFWGHTYHTTLFWFFGGVRTKMVNTRYPLPIKLISNILCDFFPSL